MIDLEKTFKTILDELRDGEMELAGTISHVKYYMIEKTGYSFHFYAVHTHNGKEALSEVFYDLRNKKYFVKRNGKEVRFNIPNLDLVIPRMREWSHDSFHDYSSVEKFFKIVSVEDNKGMYESMLKAIGSFGEERINMTSRALIRLITEYNKLELIYKAGIDITKTSSRLRYLVLEAGEKDVRKLHEIFGLTKSQYKFMQEHGFSAKDIIDYAKDMSFLTQKDMDEYRGYITYVKKLGEKYLDDSRLPVFRGQASVRTYVEQMARKNDENRNPDDYWFWGYVAQQQHPNTLKMIEYLLFECYFSQGLEFSAAYSEYKDYYKMCEDLEYARFDKYPKYLRTQHDIVTRNYRSAVDAVTAKKFRAQMDKYQDLSTDRLKGYKIVIPSEPKELVTEGNSLQHCVASYVKRIADGNSAIVFLRQKDELESPLVTVEIRGKKIVQARGFANRKPDEDEREALRTFAKRHKFETASYI
ncbi:hypothetical protein BCP01_021 [Bacillus phage BCP01]|nr:hypothetical protein BCP01_021 [Bacillus phage BCP01]